VSILSQVFAGQTSSANQTGHKIWPIQKRTHMA